MRAAAERWVSMAPPVVPAAIQQTPALIGVFGLSTASLFSFGEGSKRKLTYRRCENSNCVLFSYLCSERWWKKWCRELWDQFLKWCGECSIILWEKIRENAENYDACEVLLEVREWIFANYVSLKLLLPIICYKKLYWFISLLKWHFNFE